MTEVKVAEPGRKQETTPQHGRMNLHFGAPLPPQNRPFLMAALRPHIPFEGAGTLASPLGITRMLWSKALSGIKGSTLGCSRRGFFTHFGIFAALGGFFPFTLMFLAPFSHVPRAMSFILLEHPQSFSNLARGHPRAGYSFLPFLHFTAGNPQIWGPTRSCCPQKPPGFIPSWYHF